MYQNHEAHIQVHMNFMQDPKMAQMMGQNPNAQAIQSAAMAHINEHLAFAYKQQMEETMGIMIPSDEDENMIPRDLESEISAKASQASDVLLNRNKTAIAAQQAQQAAQDPVIQMQAKELQLKEEEVQRKKQKDIMDAAAKADQQKIEEQRILSQERIAGLQIGAKTAKDRQELQMRQLQTGVQVGQSIAQSQQPTPPKTGKTK
jgi:hypothetical protein